MTARIKIDYLGNVWKPDLRARGGFWNCGHLICGPDRRGYTISTLGGIEHVPANRVSIRLTSGGPWLDGETVMEP